MTNAIDASLTARVNDLNALILDGSVPTLLTAPGDDEALVQIVDGDGTVLAASPNIDGEGPISDQRPQPGLQTVTSRALPIGEGRFRLIARSVPAHGRTFTVYAASSLEPVTDAVSTLSAILVVGLPPLIAFVGATVWFIVGATLHPVEAIRNQVDSIGNRELNRRVPVPEVDDEIGRLAITMNQMLERLETAANQQRRFVADASHELRSPLAAIRSQLEVNLVHPQQADWVAAHGAVLDETLRMQKLVDDLLLLARSDTGTLPAAREAVDLDDVIFAVAERLRTSEIDVSTALVSGAQVLADPAALERVVRNAIDNAARYARERVVISLSEADGWAILTVDDDGPGIPAADRARVFERFTRLDEARDRGHGGAGLGLAIAKEIIDHHGGTVSIGTSPLGGTRLTVRLATTGA